VDIALIRPSQDLGKLAREYEPTLPASFRYLVRSAGARDTRSPDLLSFLLFQPEYVRRLMEIGEADGERQAAEISALIRT
jgi:NTE family protein